MYRNSRFHFLALFVVCLASTTLAEDAPSSKSFVYKKTEQGELSLTAFLPADWKPDQKRAAIVFFFGGGWTKGSTKQFEPQSDYLAKRGMVAICADYRVKSRHHVTPDLCVEDAKSAIRWVRQHADQLGIDTDRIVGAGGSAGGHLAACTGICKGLDSKKEDLTTSSQPNVLVLFNPVLNFDSPKLIERLEDKSNLAAALSPTQKLTKDAPPTLLLFGKDDTLLTQGEEFVKRSKELGHHSELFLADGVGHGFFNRSPWKEKTLERVDEFLVSLGYLKPSSNPQAAAR